MQIKQQLKQILDHNWFFPIILLNYGLFNILFAEKFPANNGFGTDGYVYQTLITQFNHSFFFDSFYIHRILPSFLIREILMAFSIEFSPGNIFYCFELLNLLSVVAAAYFVKKILQFFNIHFKNQLLAFCLLFINFALLKWPYYFPAMTDTLAFSLSIILLYFYLKQNTAGLIVISILLAFTWPMGYYQGLLLIAFPYQKIPFKPFSLNGKAMICFLSVMLYIVSFICVIIINKTDTNLIYVPKIIRDMLPYTVAILIVFYLGYAKLFFNSELFNLKLFFELLNKKRVGLALGTFILILLFIAVLKVPQTTIYKMSTVLENPIVHSAVRPGLSFVAHFGFYGIILCLLLFFWRDLTMIISQSGWGLVGAIALNLYLFGIMPESRMLINLFPWLTIFLVLAINNFKFSNAFYVAVGCLCFIGSKVWLLIAFENDYKLANVVDEHGSMDFPNQRFYMNLGPWMSERSLYFHGAAFLISMGILFLLLYRVGFPSKEKIGFKRKF
jgi:hypothetical protein